MNLHIKKVRCGGFLIVNHHTKQHTHVETKKTADTFVKLLRSGIKPSSEYLVESARKILTEDEFRRLKKKRDRCLKRKANKKPPRG